MKTIIGTLAVLVVLVLLEIIRELHTFRVTRYEIMSEKLGGMQGKKRVLFLSDLHNQVYGKGNQKLLAAVKNEHPDLILIGGDMLVGKPGQAYRPAADFVKELPKICPVYYANGNHEQRMKEQPEKYGAVYVAYKEELVNAGVHFLENESECTAFGNAKIKITGLEIPAGHFTRFQKKELEEKVLSEHIGKSDALCYQILLAHNPGYMEEYLRWGADLILSGHLHGGIVRIPGLGGVISPGFELFPKYSGGCCLEGNQTVVVSKGLGSHTIPIRLLNPAEVVVLTLSEGCET